MASLATVYRGQTVKGKIQLRQKDAVNPDLENPYSIPVGATIEIKFPGDPTTVVLSTANAGEITVVDATLSTVSFLMSAAKSATLALTASAAVDCIVTDTSIVPNNVDIFEAVKVIKIVDPANL